MSVVMGEVNNSCMIVSSSLIVESGRQTYPKVLFHMPPYLPATLPSSYRLNHTLNFQMSDNFLARI